MTSHSLEDKEIIGKLSNQELWVSWIKLWLKGLFGGADFEDLNNLVQCSFIVNTQGYEQEAVEGD